jgi:HAD superfamily phosphoserine phosphatase-like hydrolase
MKDQPANFNVYDFDRTVYDGNSAVDFYLYCLRKKPSLIKYFPSQLYYLSLYSFKLISRTEFKSKFFIFLNGETDIESTVQSFWVKNMPKIKSWYAESDHHNDIVISASPAFYLSPLAQKLKIYRLIATDMDPKTGNIIGENCYGAEKVKRLNSELPNINIDKVYTDSLSDLPLLRLGKKAFIVSGENIIELGEYQKMPEFKRRLAKLSSIL